MRKTYAVVLVLLAGLTLGACSGSDEPVSEGKSPEDVIALAGQTLDETSGLNLTLNTDNLPDGVNGITGAEGVSTDAPAFEGTISVVVGGLAVDVPVIAVDDKVYAQIPGTSVFQPVDPAAYGAPDPARLVTPDQGFSALLSATEDLAEGDSVRGGADNDEILTEYTGTVPGDVIKAIIPNAPGDSYDVTYLVSDGGELREADLTGVFYEDATEEMTYTVGFEDYGTTKEIQAP